MIIDSLPSLNRLKADTEYDEQKDVTLYKMPTPQGDAVTGNGIFAVFFWICPCPVLCIENPELIKKVVIEVDV